jgi:hypothetical protein
VLLACSGNVYRGGPLVGVARKILAAGTKFSETSMAGPLGAAVKRSSSSHHRSWRRRWQAPWGLLMAGPAAATTGVGDVDGGPPGVLPVGPVAATTGVGDVDGGPPFIDGNTKLVLQKKMLVVK